MEKDLNYAELKGICSNLLFWFSEANRNDQGIKVIHDTTCNKYLTLKSSARPVNKQNGGKSVRS